MFIMSMKISFGFETQGRGHYAMSVHIMLQDALEYMKQVQELENKHKESGEILWGDEFLDKERDKVCVRQLMI